MLRGFNMGDFFSFIVKKKFVQTLWVREGLNKDGTLFLSYQQFDILYFRATGINQLKEI